MRITLIGIYLFFFFLAGLFWTPRLNYLRKKNPREFYCISNIIVRRNFSRVLWIAGVKCIVNGQQNIPDETCLYVSNHRSYFDILTTHVTINRPVGYVAKSEMLRIPFLSQWMRNIGCLFIDRTDPKAALKTITAGANMLKQGFVSLYIFPEGTRGHGEDMAPFKKGSFKMAEKSNVPIVPIGIVNSDNILENNGAFRKVRAKKVYINIGKPIYLDRLSPEHKKQINSYVQDIVAQLITEMKQEYHLK
jgi:1-acyl-sn-glycerol-3-phosphate acyltransferase